MGESSTRSGLSAGRRLAPSPGFPFDPSRLPFFYGWAVVVLSTAGVVASIPGQTMGISVFTDPVLEATGLSRLGFSNAYLLGTVASGLLLPWGGRWVDRHGVRLSALLASLGLAATLWTLSVADRVVSALGDVRFLGPLFFGLAFFCLRFCGQGMLTLTSRTMLGRWFDRRRGLVAAGSGALIGFAFSLAPVVFLAWINRSDWQGAWREMGLLLCVFGLVALVFFRDRPEEIGQAMDGDAVRPAMDELARDLEISGLEMEGWDLGGGSRALDLDPAIARVDWTREEAVRTLGFWLLTGTLAIQSLVGTAITFHIVDLGAEHGLAPEAVVGIFLPIAVVSVGLGFLVGWLVDVVAVAHLLRLMLLGEGVAFFAATGLGEPLWRWTMIAAWGVAAGCYGPLTVAALPRLFGRLHLGAISGIMTMFLVIGSAVGPALFALSKELTGAYEAALLASCALPLAGLAVSWRMRRGRRAAGG